jgi:molybdopterin-containing oxidoreductase family iron-sulfur binding subunit
VRPTNQRAALQELVGEMNAGTVSLLIILGANPYTAPADLNFTRAMEVALRAHLGLYHDETAALCHWHTPETHFLERHGATSRRRGNGVGRPAADRAPYGGARRTK